eukprot:4248492-Amphidinium_carterae.1
MLFEPSGSPLGEVSSASASVGAELSIESVSPVPASHTERFLHKVDCGVPHGSVRAHAYIRHIPGEVVT